MTLRVIPSTRQGLPAQRLLSVRPLELSQGHWASATQQERRETTSWDCSARGPVHPGPAQQPPQSQQPGAAGASLQQPHCHSSCCHRHEASKRDRIHPGLSLLTKASAGKENREPGKTHLGSNLELQQCQSLTVPCASRVLTFHIDNFQNRALPFLDYISAVISKSNYLR